MFGCSLHCLGSYFPQFFILVNLYLLVFIFAAAIAGIGIFFHSTPPTGCIIGMRKIGLHQFSHAIVKMNGKPGGYRHIQQQ